MQTIIDIHTHIFPDDLAAHVLATLSERAGHVPAHTDGTCAGLLASMAHAGVTQSVLTPVATRPSQARSINSWTVALGRQHPGLIPFGSIHPAQTDWREEIDRLVADGVPGIKFHPDYQEFFVDDPAVFPLYRALAEAGIMVLFHAGVDIGLPPPVHCPPDRLARLLDAVPNLTVIAAHMGGYAQWDDVERFLVGRDLYLDTAYSLTSLGPTRMAELIRAHGAHKVLFGTDSPWTDQATEIHAFQSLHLSGEEIDAVLGGNARHLLANHAILL